MCLRVDGKKTADFKRVGKTKVQVLKRLSYDTEMEQLITPIMCTPVEAGWFKAENPLDRIKVNKTGSPSQKEIDGGGIHCYNAKTDLSGYSEEIVKCWAYAEDFIAADSKRELVFKKIWIPIEEVERIEKKYRRRKR